MIYGHGIGASALFGGSRPARHSVAAPRLEQRSWRKLDGETRLALVEQTLSPANGRVAGFPPAL